MRKARKIIPGAIYHVIARTNGKEMLLDSELAKDLFLQVLRQARERHSFRIDNFVIMGNHFHLLIQPLKESTLAEIMKWILGVYTMTYNRVYLRWGHFWGSRYFSRTIGSLPEYLKIFHYIDQNPVKANLVNSICQWPWSGYVHNQTGNTVIVAIPPIYVLMLHPDRLPKILVTNL